MTASRECRSTLLGPIEWDLSDSRNRFNQEAMRSDIGSCGGWYARWICSETTVANSVATVFARSLASRIMGPNSLRMRGKKAPTATPTASPVPSQKRSREFIGSHTHQSRERFAPTQCSFKKADAKIPPGSVPILRSLLSKMGLTPSHLRFFGILQDRELLRHPELYHLFWS